MRCAVWPSGCTPLSTMFGCKRRPDDTSRTLTLDALLRAVKGAVFDANGVVRDQHISELGEFYDQAGTPAAAGAANSGSSDVVLVPKVVRLRMPSLTVPENVDPTPPVEVPLPTLVQSDALVVDELQIDFGCTLIGVEPSRGDDARRILVRLGDAAGAPGSAARLSIRYRSAPPPEGVARINDALLRGVQ